MAELTKDMIRRIIEETPCIECGEEYWQAGKTQYFHKPFCQRGSGLHRDTLFLRLQQRANEMKQRSKPRGILRCRCGAVATGTNWAAYHDLSAVVSAEPVCKQHSEIEDTSGRMHGHFPHIITNDTFEVQSHLKVLLA